MKENPLIVALSFVFAVLAVLLVAGAKISPESIILPDLGLLEQLIPVIPSLALILVAGLLIKWSSKEKKRRLALWSAMLFLVVVLAYLLQVDFVVLAFLVATAFGTVLPIWTEDPCKQGIMYLVSSPRTLATVFVLATLVLYGEAHLGQLQSAVKNKIVDVAVVSAGGMANFVNVDAIVPPGVSERERQELIDGISQADPYWSQYSEEQRQQIIDNYVKQFAVMKDVLRKTIAEEASNFDEEKVKGIMEEQISSIPVAKMLLENVHLLFALLCAMIYSMVMLPAEWLALLMGVVLKLLAKKKD